MDKASTLLSILEKANTKKNDVIFLPFVKCAIETAIFSQKPLILLTFTCSTINPQYMYDVKNPELYVSLDPEGNNLEVDLPTLASLYKQLNLIYPTKLIIFIGNTDPFYIYTEEVQRLPGVTTKEFWKRFSKRWKLYKKNLGLYIQKAYPSLNPEIISWYELEKEWVTFGWDFKKQFNKTLQKIDTYFPKSDFEWELTKLENSFGKGKYFYNLKKPSQKTLQIWVKKKFAEYAVQGLWIKFIFQNAILLQNEKPSDLRSKMYQPLIKSKLNSRLPIIYPYGVDNSGYQ